MATIFSKIAAGDIPSYRIAEDDRYFAFLDINPLAKGHVLVIPKKEVDYIFDLEDELLADMMVFAKRIAVAMKKVIPCLRIGVAVLGLEVPHAHIHLVPLNSESDISFQKPRVKLTQDEFVEIAKKIAEAL